MTRALPATARASGLATPQAARARVALRSFEAEAEIAVTPAGLVAAGALVAAVVLSVVPVIRAAKARREEASRR